jgi:hypothetical protein
MRAHFFSGGQWVPVNRTRPIWPGFAIKAKHFLRLRLRKPPGSAHRRAIELLRENNAYAYNHALRLHKKAKEKGFQRLYFLDHSLPLNSLEYPHFIGNSEAQLYLKDTRPTGPTRILACFTGWDKNLNIPIPCFHSLACHHFDGIVYFFDTTQSLYLEIFPLVLDAIHALQGVCPNPAVSLIGCSAGAGVLFRIQQFSFIQRRLSASPLLLRDQVYCEELRQGNLQGMTNSRIFFAASNSVDTPHYRFLQETLPAELFQQIVHNIDWLSFSHGTLATIMSIGRLNDQLGWLANPASSLSKKH